ncbi:MAG: prepilin-type N-terminal cleavage/methylation domain-containing protein [Candidatus Omnitrophica bacterium]|nr:prepilin-type N-terminal cleavage/methylation domain-containing protein [Candidatus Omnitrophota bacterium]
MLVKYHIKSFTLIELILVIAIISLLTGAIIPVINSAIEDTRVSMIMNTYHTIKVACENFYSDTGLYPFEDPRFNWLWLSQDPGVVNGWDGPYINRPINSKDNPYGGDVFVNHGVFGFGIGGNFVYLEFDNIPIRIAKKVDKLLDNKVEANWRYKGRVQYFGIEPNAFLYFFIIGDGYYYTVVNQ